MFSFVHELGGGCVRSLHGDLRYYYIAQPRAGPDIQVTFSMAQENTLTTSIKASRRIQVIASYGEQKFKT